MRLIQTLGISVFILFSSTVCGCGSKSETESTTKIKTDSVATTTIDSTIVHTVKVKHLGGSLRTIFNDKNPVHLSVATVIGIKPISDLRSAYNVKLPIVKIKSCNEYQLDTLTYSLPYLIPQAATLLSEIGKRFSDTITARSGGHPYKLRVTSVLRTEGSVEKLRRRNKNASDSSAHQYGTTFDISYVKFIPGNPNYRLSQESLKNVLAEVLFDLRNSGRCFVKYEVRQGCFHITAR